MRQYLYLHVGAHKTGSTSLQYALGKNADRLRQSGFLFPSASRIHYAHRRLAFGLRNKQDPLVGDIPDPDQEVQSIIREIEESSPCTTIVSCEGFFALDKKSIRFLSDRFRSFDTKVVLYIRRQDNMLLSIYNQKIKKRKKEFSKRFPEVLSDPKKYVDDYRGIIERWSSIFGPENVIVRCYELAGDVVADFQNVVGIPIVLVDPSTPIRRNTSVSVNGIRAFGWLKPLIRNEAHRKWVLKLLKKLPLGNDVSRLLTDSDRRRILEHFRQDNAYIFRKYLNSDNLYDPDLAAAGPGEAAEAGLASSARTG